MVLFYVVVVLPMGRRQKKEQANLLQRLGIGAPLAAHWSRVRARYTIKAQ